MPLLWFYCRLIVEESDITALLHNDLLLMKVADLLEQNSGISLQRLAVMLGVEERSKLASTQASRRFFTHLAQSRPEITLEQIKNLVEEDLPKQNRQIFRYIRKWHDSFSFNLYRSLGHIWEDIEDWLCLLEILADKLVENENHLPSWKDIASAYGYDNETVEIFRKNVCEERPTVKLFKLMACRPYVPKVCDLMSCLGRVKRYDIIRLLKGQVNH